jgi:hypothetical protein
MKTFAVLSVLAGSIAVAGAVSPSLTSISPLGAQRGTELEIFLKGDRLDDAKEVMLYFPGIEVLKLEEIKSGQVKVRVKVAPDCRIGEHAMRVRTSSGISDVRTFWIGPFPSVEEKEPNNEPAKAQKLSMNCTVEGVIEREDVDCFQIEAKKGERISVEVEGIRMGRLVFDSLVTIRDADGSVLKTADGSSLVLQDAITTLLAPKDGIYTIELRESSYGGGPNSVYRMHVGNFPRPMAVYPAGGKAGEPLQVKFIGDVAGDFMQQFKLPTDPKEKLPVIAEQRGLQAPSPNWLRASPFPNVLEAEPNNDLDHATATDLELPAAFNGVLAEKGDTDFFRFKAKKGDAFDVNVFARRIRSPLDSTVAILDAKGGSVASNDDSSGLDSYVKFTAPADGDYFLKVGDQLGRGGPLFTYRVEIAQVPGTAALYIPDVSRNNTQERKSIVVPRGNRFATLLAVKRANFSGDLELKADGLPDGIKMEADAMLTKLDRIPVVFEAGPDATIGGKFFNITATCPDPAKPVKGFVKQDFELVYVNNVGLYHNLSVDKLAVAVAEEVPFKLNIAEPKVPLVQNGTMELKILAERQKDFDEPINVRMLWNPPGVGSLPDMNIPKGENSVTYRLNANGGADLRKWKIAVIGSAKVNGGTAWVSSQLATLEVAEPFVRGRIDLSKTEQGQPVKVTCKLDQKTAFDGKATVKLMGLPNGCSAPEAQITKEDKEVVFNVTTDPKSPVGMHKSLFCYATVPMNGELIPHNVGYGVLRIDAPKAKAAEAKPAAKTAALSNPTENKPKSK